MRGWRVVWLRVRGRLVGGGRGGVRGGVGGDIELHILCVVHSRGSELRCLVSPVRGCELRCIVNSQCDVMRLRTGRWRHRSEGKTGGYLWLSEISAW
jgi:hypothetical protein